MSAIREPGRINANTTLIDIGMYGVTGVTAVYLIEGERTCLIDGGTRTEASRIVRALRELNAFPPDIILLTHSHYDHVQGVPELRKEAAKEGKRIDVMASHRAIPLLEDQSYNNVFDAGPYANITDVLPLQEGEMVDLGGPTLSVYEIPGHHKDHLAILDQETRTLFVGDALGIKVADDAFIPPFMPPFWDPVAFRSSMDRLKQIDYESLCLAHFGYIYGDEARSILDEAVVTCDAWWQLFETNANRLDDADYMLEAVLEELHPGRFEPEILSLKLKVLYGLMTGWNRLTRKSPPPIRDLLLGEIIGMLATGYRTYKSQ
jgi:glyoxylase-like metal-dependent hydrolase (beta-lactamase superfamily II)